MIYIHQLYSIIALFAHNFVKVKICLWCLKYLLHEDFQQAVSKSCIWVHNNKGTDKAHISFEVDNLLLWKMTCAVFKSHCYVLYIKVICTIVRLHRQLCPVFKYKICFFSVNITVALGIKHCFIHNTVGQIRIYIQSDQIATC